MNITIGKDYVITSDQHNLILNKRLKKGEKAKAVGEWYLSPIGFYTNLHGVATKLVDLQVRESEVKDLRTMAALLDRVKTEILAAVPNMKAGKEKT